MAAPGRSPGGRSVPSAATPGSCPLASPSGVEPSGGKGPAAALGGQLVQVAPGNLVGAGDPALSAHRFLAGGGDRLGGGRLARLLAGGRSGASYDVVGELLH
jgi:hypothetical protein